MEHLKKLLTMAAMIALVLFVACTDDDDDDDMTGNEDQQAVAALLANDGQPWTVSASGGVTLESVEQTEWAGFTLSFSSNSDANGGSFTTQNSASDLVWPVSGTWTFGSNVNTLIRVEDEVTMTVNVSETNLELSFDIVDEAVGGRTMGFAGRWLFRFDN